MNLQTQIIISVLTILIALGLGLYFRLLLVRRLKKTVLDNWLIQLFGALVVILPYQWAGNAKKTVLERMAASLASRLHLEAHRQCPYRPTSCRRWTHVNQSGHRGHS